MGREKFASVSPFGRGNASKFCIVTCLFLQKRARQIMPCKKFCRVLCLSLQKDTRLCRKFCIVLFLITSGKLASVAPFVEDNAG